MTRREIDRVKPAHRMTDHDSTLDSQRVEHGQRVRGEVRGRVAIRGPSTLTVAARVRGYEREATGDRVGEKIPVAPVVSDAMKQEGRRPGAGPPPIHELRAVAGDRTAGGGRDG